MSTSLTTWVAVFALLLAYLALVAAYVALRTLARLRRDSALLARGTRGPQGRQSLIEAAQRQAEFTASVAEKLDGLHSRVEEAREQALAIVSARQEEAAGTLRNLALVRYDAFPGMSGRTSFSLALLDEGGDGVTISAISGQSETRVYAKAITDGKGEHELSPVEGQAVRAALAKRPRGTVPSRRAG
jgi:hypothetical protein